MASDHYYSKQPSSVREPRTIEAQLRGRVFRFMTDAGVFSKTEVDFGSRLLIESMQIKVKAKIADMGSGYGPIGLVAAWLAREGQATLFDMNERAVELAERNAQLNGLENVRCLQSDLFERAGAETFDVVLTNPPIRAGKQVVHRIFAESFNRLTRGGSLWVVIQKKQGAPSALAKLESLFGEVREAAKDRGYRVYEAIKQ